MRQPNNQIELLEIKPSNLSDVNLLPCSDQKPKALDLQIALERELEQAIFKEDMESIERLLPANQATNQAIQGIPLSHYAFKMDCSVEFIRKLLKITGYRQLDNQGNTIAHIRVDRKDYSDFINTPGEGILLCAIPNKLGKYPVNIAVEQCMVRLREGLACDSLYASIWNFKYGKALQIPDQKGETIFHQLARLGADDHKFDHLMHLIFQFSRPCIHYKKYKHSLSILDLAIKNKSETFLHYVVLHAAEEGDWWALRVIFQKILDTQILTYIRNHHEEDIISHSWRAGQHKIIAYISDLKLSPSKFRYMKEDLKSCVDFEKAEAEYHFEKRIIEMAEEKGLMAVLDEKISEKDTYIVNWYKFLVYQLNEESAQQLQPTEMRRLIDECLRVNHCIFEWDIYGIGCKYRDRHKRLCDLLSIDNLELKDEVYIFLMNAILMNEMSFDAEGRVDLIGMRFNSDALPYMHCINQDDVSKAVQMLRYFPSQGKGLALKKWVYATLADVDVHQLDDNEENWLLLTAEAYQLILECYRNKDYSPFSGEMLDRFEQYCTCMNSVALGESCRAMSDELNCVNYKANKTSLH